jgi:hypothetical protein
VGRGVALRGHVWDLSRCAAAPRLGGLAGRAWGGRVADGLVDGLGTSSQYSGGSGGRPVAFESAPELKYGESESSHTTE